MQIYHLSVSSLADREGLFHCQARTLKVQRDRGTEAQRDRGKRVKGKKHKDFLSTYMIKVFGKGERGTLRVFLNIVVSITE